mgnify:CR=1 FL=1
MLTSHIPKQSCANRPVRPHTASNPIAATVVGNTIAKLIDKMNMDMAGQCRRRAMAIDTGMARHIDPNTDNAACSAALLML